MAPESVATWVSVDLMDCSTAVTMAGISPLVKGVKSLEVSFSGSPFYLFPLLALLVT